jgi:hypothetical protein
MVGRSDYHAYLRYPINHRNRNWIGLIVDDDYIRIIRNVHITRDGCADIPGDRQGGIGNGHVNRSRWTWWVAEDCGRRKKQTCNYADSYNN